jgi:hypothetical protein
VYKVYEQDANLLEGIGEAELTDEKIKCVAFKLSKFRLLSLLSALSSEINPPPVTTTLHSGACLMSSVAKKKAKSSLERLKAQRLYLCTLF